MTKNKQTKLAKSQKRSKINPRLAAMFKMTREELALRKTTGGGIHRTHRDLPRSEQKRRAVSDEVTLTIE